MTFQAGRFTLCATHLEGLAYVTSWDTWEDAEGAFPESNGGRMPDGHQLVDNDTGRVWYPGTKHEWEDAQT